MPPKFGTSGLRGLVSELSDDCVAVHVRAFLRAVDPGRGLYVGQDLRPSSPRIADSVIRAAVSAGAHVTDCGAVPTPALALAAMSAGAASVMVTGSHIPADRNGLKFNRPDGEITKGDEAAIQAQVLLGDTHGARVLSARPMVTTDVGDAYVRRYLAAYGAGALEGMRVGVYTHSTVGRDFLVTLMQILGAEVIEVGRSDRFVPVDTEAIDQDTRVQIAHWVDDHRLDALISADGDADRPLLADETGRVVAGDLLGQITAAELGADTVVTPVSSSTSVDLSGHFRRVIRTKIGSPYVIAGMNDARGRSVGYEANGGFLLGYDARGPAGDITRLMTRDSFLPIVACLFAAWRAGGVSARVAAEPRRFTAAQRLAGVATERSHAFLERLQSRPGERADLLSRLGQSETAVDLTDGLRMTLRDGRFLHFRPSGNAPEFRVYVEAETVEASSTLLEGALDLIARELGAGENV